MSLPLYELLQKLNTDNDDTKKRDKSSDEVNAAILLNQMDIMTKQAEMDAVLAEILLNGLGV